MQTMTSVKKLVLTAVCAALCVVLPMAFHSIPNAGSIFLPMHIPVMLCGLICGWPFGLVCGVLGPLISSVLTSMPPAAYLPSMMVECGVYGLVTGLMMRYVRTGHPTADLYLSILGAMILGRTAAGFAKAYLLSSGSAPFAWVTTSLVTGLPGIALQLALIPPLVLTLTRAHLIPQRYPERRG